MEDVINEGRLKKIILSYTPYERQSVFSFKLQVLSFFFKIQLLMNLDFLSLDPE